MSIISARGYAVSRVSCTWCDRVCVIVGLMLMTQVLLPTGGWSHETAFPDMLASIPVRSEVLDQEPGEPSIIDVVLSVALPGPDGRCVKSGISGKAKIPLIRPLTDKQGEQTAAQAVLPGAMGQYPRPASFQTTMPVFKRQGAAILDSSGSIEVAGGLVADPSGIFPSFDILVDKSQFTLSLYAMKGPGEGKVLFYCKVGIGSGEYPTPTGTYYLLRIYDDNPLWIPPPSDWAYGMAPSHSVYGGHMLPLFKKIPGEKTNGNEETVFEPDGVDSKRKIIDSGGYRLHGTDSPWSVGSGQSHGCIRMKNNDVKALSELLKLYVGTTGRDRSANGPYVNLSKPVRVTLHSR